MTPTLTPYKLSRLIEFAEARAYVDMVHAAPPEWGFRAEESELATVLVSPSLNIPLFNRAIGIGLNSSARKKTIESLVNVFSDAGVTNFAIQVSPTAKPAHIKKWLTARNLTVRDNWAKVYRLPEPVVHKPDALPVKYIGRDQADIFARIACAAFKLPDNLQSWLTAIVGRPGWYHYLAWDGTEVIAAAAMYVHEKVGWLGIAGTIPAYRKRGAQSDLMAKRIRDGLDLGCEWFVTETGEDLPQRPNSSYHNMLRNGFKLAYQRPNYMPAI
jgi:hypothetical protein